MAEFTAVSMAAEGGIIEKTEGVSVTLKFFSNRWKHFCILCHHNPISLKSWAEMHSGSMVETLALGN